MIETITQPTVAGYSAQELVDMFPRMNLTPIRNAYHADHKGVRYGCIKTLVRAAGIDADLTDDQMESLEWGWENEPAWMEQDGVLDAIELDQDAVEVGRQAAAIAKPGTWTHQQETGTYGVAPYAD